MDIEQKAEKVFQELLGLDHITDREELKKEISLRMSNIDKEAEQRFAIKVAAYLKEQEQIE